jgi:hypothetical protein
MLFALHSQTKDLAVIANYLPLIATTVVLLIIFAFAAEASCQ